ncbi:MAG TPA: Ig-like domain-containing protein [Gemmatimonadaceae bacterium]|nr:Ig-like domain-containing protein [Gemmatimonadaceae bacterium]
MTVTTGGADPSATPENAIGAATTRREPAILDPSRRRVRPAIRQILLRGALVAAVAGVGITCDASRALSPGASPRVALAREGDDVLPVGGIEPLAVTVTVDDQALEHPRLRVTSSDSTVLAVRADGDSLLGRARGRAVITVTLESTLLPPAAATLSWAMRVGAADFVVEPAEHIFTAVGDTATLDAMALDANDAAMPDIPVQWSSSDPQVATVNARGRVTAVSPGVAQVVATAPDDGLVAIASVTVAPRVDHVAFAPTGVLFDALGAEATIAAQPRDANGHAVGGATVALAACNAAITVSPGGVVAAVANGESCVVARSADVVDSLPVRVAQRASRVEITPLQGTVITALGGSLLFTAQGYDARNVLLASGTANWYSRSPAVAQVDATGRVLGIGEGGAQIVAAIGDASAEVGVTVGNYAAEVVFRPGVATLPSVFDTLLVHPVVLNTRGDSIPSAGAGVELFALDPQVVRLLPAHGFVEAAGAGIGRVVGKYGALADTMYVTVTNAPAAVELLRAADTLAFLGDTVTLPADVRNARQAPLPPTALDWSTDDPAVATVRDGGLVTAVGVGDTWVRGSSGTLGDATRIVVRNDPASVVLDHSVDTLAALGQTVRYRAEVRNAGGALLVDYPMAWRSTNTAVATVAADGTVTTTGYGATEIYGRAGTVEASVRVQVTNLTRIYADNGAAVVGPRLGTRTRPYARIQDAVLAADPGDTVLVMRGVAPYSETVAIGRRLTLLGDSTDFIAAGRDPSRLPVLAHDSGTVALVARTAAPVKVAYLAIRHSVDGPSVRTVGTDAQLEWLYVNPGAVDFAGGQGIAVDSAPTRAVLANVEVRGVRGYGVRLIDVVGGDIRDAVVQLVNMAPGMTGAGVEVRGGTGTRLTRVRARRAAGPQVLLDGTADVALTASDLAGEAQLVRVDGGAGPVVIEGNVLDLRRGSDEPFTGNSATDGRSGIEVSAASGVLVRANAFVAQKGTTSLMDAVRLIGARGTPYGVRLDANTFGGGRYAVRSENSVWTMAGGRVDSAATALVVAAGDSAVVEGVVLSRGTAGCVRVSGGWLRVERTRFDECVTTTAPAVQATGGAIHLVSDTVLAAPAPAVLVTGARRLTVTGSHFQASMGAAPNGDGAVDAAADTVEVLSSVVRGFTTLAGVTARGGRVVVQSSRLTENRFGLELGARTALTVSGNDIYDNVVAGIYNSVATSASVSGNWWGDGRGVRSSSNPGFVGDSAIGSVARTPIATSPAFPGTPALALRIVGGLTQPTPITRNVPLIPYTVRVVDTNGRPVAGVSVTFRMQPQDANSAFLNTLGVTQVTMVSDASGLAYATLTFRVRNIPIAVNVTAVGVTTGVSFPSLVATQ